MELGYAVRYLSNVEVMQCCIKGGSNKAALIGQVLQ